MKFSIITVNQNNAEGLEKTILSVFNQTFNNYEYIVIDGASTDDSIGIIKKYSDKIHYWISEPDNGIFHAMNKGIKKATGEYLIFMNSGDCFINRDILQNIFSQNYSEDLLAGNVVLDNKIKERRVLPKKLTFYYFLIGTLHHQGTFIKRNLFDEIGLYDENLEVSSDWIFFLLAVIKYNKSIRILNEDIALRQLNGIASSDKGMALAKEIQDRTIQEYFPYFYEDYKELYRLKRFSFSRIKRHFKWRLRKFLYQ